MYFDGNNYAYSKICMRAFLKSLDECWPKPTTNIDTWSKDELNACNWNSKELHVIFMAVSLKQFKRISMCEIAKDARDILEVTHEGTKIVKNSKVQMLTSKFEDIKT